jgi:hypothetical protein
VLRIYLNEETEPTTLRLEGSLAGPWVAELEKCWRTASARRPNAAIIVELKGVTFVDDRGRDLLFQMRRKGNSLVPTGCLMKAIVEKIDADIRRQEGEVV